MGTRVYILYMVATVLQELLERESVFVGSVPKSIMNICRIV